MRNSATIRYTLALVALMMGFALSVRFSERGLLFDSPGGDLLANPPATPDGYDLQALTILNRVLLQMGDNYVEPDRIDAHRMLVHALDRVQNSVPEVVTLFDTDMESYPSTVEVHVGESSQSFEIGEIGSLWEMSFKLREIFRFLQEHLDPSDMDLREVEYNAINGLLGTLDPHSVLLTPDVYAEMQASNRGSFGGLGIVISIRDGQLTVISPIPDTPASRAGFQAGDRIVQINNESTVNMPLDEAVSRLRGPENTTVTVEIMRQGGRSRTRSRSPARSSISSRSLIKRSATGSATSRFVTSRATPTSIFWKRSTRSTRRWAASRDSSLISGTTPAVCFNRRSR